MPDYVTQEQVSRLPRIPLEGNLDLTYRCNNNCRHCWLRIPPNAPEREQELTLEEIKDIVTQARRLGTRHWGISGGEPMLRPEFAEIFELITGKATSYSLNTNGTLITPAIARLLKRKGNKMVALYGATAEVYDHVARRPGSFEQVMRGFAYLKEAGAGFTVQLIPLRDNYHQWPQMIELATSLSSRWRIGASWLYLSADGDPARNQEIMRQRLDPQQEVDLLPPPFEEATDNEDAHEYQPAAGDDRLLAPCIAYRRDFHVDPYGQLTFCGFIKDSSLRYDLRRGSLLRGWEEFIPSLADRVRGGTEYRDNCAACDLRHYCQWCPVYGYLEHHRFAARVEYLCAMARENRCRREDWEKNHCRYFRIAGITIKVESDLAISEATFHPVFKPYEVAGPGDDMVSVQYHWGLPSLNGHDLGQLVYNKPPWMIYRKPDAWEYLSISETNGETRPLCAAVFNRDHTRARIYYDRQELFTDGNLGSLTLVGSDQMWIARLLADRQGFYLHSSGVALNGQGALFVGHSGAGKTTILRLLAGQGEALGEDRNIVRRWAAGWQVYGTWNNCKGQAVASAGSAPLRGVLFLEKAAENRLVRLSDRVEIARRLLGCLIRPLETTDWWDKTLAAVNQLTRDVPCYVMHFDGSGTVVEALRQVLVE